ncbi:MAG: CsbD family protein [Cyanobacteria bacterium P01_G01_bin.38]
MKPFIKPLQQFRRFTLSLSLIIVLTTLATFGFGTTDSWAASISLATTTASQSQVVALFGSGKAKANAKQVEGKAQEMLGKATGDPKDQVMGQAKQVEGQIRGAAADLKDQIQPQGRAKAVTKNIEGKAQAAVGKATGDLGDQVAGHAKQLESQARNAVEDIKDINPAIK